ncbi:MAG TPA: right-handed parallel beta-helix repeat-containing protein [Mucilaginibacter sp.]|jgi:hypothetical protein|nr:right-handed parallel beta-helix repeat-containing protein [Mucilaginibacter sp.]
MNFKKYLCVFLAVITSTLIAVNSFAQTSNLYYVSNQGNDSNPGTKVQPFKTISKVNSLELRAGDAVYFKAGEIFKGSLLLTKGIKGTKLHPVIISSYGNGHAIIDARDSVGFALYKGSYIKLSHIFLRGSGRKTGNVKNGVYILNCDHITGNDLDISGFQKSGFLIYSSQEITANAVFAHDNGSAGITVEGPYAKTESQNIRILNCRAENNPGDPTNLTNHSGNGIVVGDCKNVLIDRCTATNNGWDMPRIGNGPVGIWAYEADSVTIQHCLSYKNKTSKGGADGGGFDLDGGVTNSIIQYCVSYGNQGSGYCIFQYWGATPWHNNVFRFNISENDGTVSDSQAGVYIWNSSDDEKQFHDCEVYGNIIYNSKVAAIAFSEKSESKGIRMYDNIFVGRDTLIRGKDKIGDVKYWGNDWWSIEKNFNMYGIRSLKEWATRTGLEQKDGKITGLNIKPEFANAGNSTITSASQIKTFGNYKLPLKSKLRSTSAYTGKYGIGDIRL